MLQLPTALTKISITDLTANLSFPEPFAMYPIYSLLRFIWLYLFREFFIGELATFYFFSI